MFRGMTRGDPPPATEARRDPNVVISTVASTAAVCIALTATDIGRAVRAEPWAFLVFLAATAFLQLVSIEVYNRGSMSFGGTGLLAMGFTFGGGAAMATAALMGVLTL